MHSINIINSTVVSQIAITLESPMLYCANSTLTAENIYLPDHSNIDQTNCMFHGVTHYGHTDL